ncbi:hypothetical protein T4E_1377 [Trichinella pseudospiralis]|uniref:Uncharacterized protein n=1 Tax=Trichinella pseudospiralis TaxID=6337 RepID=A0A0V0YDL5_TRIPS|nr:hypothetical protein T4E_1377 [Trichinella pseudospiralis]
MPIYKYTIHSWIYKNEQHPQTEDLNAIQLHRGRHPLKTFLIKFYPWALSVRILRADADFTSWGGNRSRAFGRICTNG